MMLRLVAAALVSVAAADIVRFDNFTAPLPAEASGVQKYREIISNYVSENLGNYSGYGIVGGRVVNPRDKYPFMAGLRGSQTGNSFCGGMLISPEYVLSAAHCWESPGSWVVVNTFNRGGSSGIQSRVASQTMHPNYNSRTLSNDFVLLRLRDRITSVTPVPLDSGNGGNSGVGTTATVMGWGATRENGPSSNELREVDVDVVSNNDCNRAVGDIDSSMICAGGVRGEDACQGDSGGPLINKRTGVLIGDVSWGIGCARAGLFGVYGRVSSVRSWIDGIVRDVQWL